MIYLTRFFSRITPQFFIQKWTPHGRRPSIWLSAVPGTRWAAPDARRREAWCPVAGPVKSWDYPLVNGSTGPKVKEVCWCPVCLWGNNGVAMIFHGIYRIFSWDLTINNGFFWRDSELWDCGGSPRGRYKVLPPPSYKWSGSEWSKMVA